MLRYLQFHNLSTTVGFVAGVVASVAIAWLLPNSTVTVHDGLECFPKPNGSNSAGFVCNFFDQRGPNDELSDQVGGLLMLVSAFFFMLLGGISSSIRSNIDRASTLSEEEVDAVVAQENKRNRWKVAFFLVGSVALLLAGTHFASN